MVRDLCLQRHGRRFLFNFTLKASHALYVSGQPEHGTSALLHLIAGFESKTSGHIYFNGQRIDSTLPAERPMSILFKQDNLFDHLSLFENAALGLHGTLSLPSSDVQKARAVLTYLGCTDTHRLAKSVDRATQQRVALARAVLRNQPLLLLNEPFLGLPFNAQVDLWRILDQIHLKMGWTILGIAQRRARQTAQFTQTRIQSICQYPTRAAELSATVHTTLPLKRKLL